MVEVWGKKGAQQRRVLIVRRAENQRALGVVKVSTIGSERGGTGVGAQAHMPAQSGLTNLLLDVAMGDRDGTRGPVEEILVRWDLTRLHWSTCTAQLLHGNRENVKQED